MACSVLSCSTMENSGRARTPYTSQKAKMSTKTAFQSILEGHDSDTTALGEDSHQAQKIHVTLRFIQRADWS